MIENPPETTNGVAVPRERAKGWWPVAGRAEANDDAENG
jgi:hypothetical protein